MQRLLHRSSRKATLHAVQDLPQAQEKIGLLHNYQPVIRHGNASDAIHWIVTIEPNGILLAAVPDKCDAPLWIEASPNAATWPNGRI